MKKLLEYVNGDVTKPNGDDNKVIIHCCNDVGGWGAGVVLAISRAWKAPELEYRKWYKKTTGTISNAGLLTECLPLGEIQIVPVAENLAVINMIGQHKTGFDKKSRPPIRYNAIKKALKKVCKYCKQNNVSVHAPMFGSDLAGGDWNKIERLIVKHLCKKGVYVTIYEYVG
jgi:O-acetyl-ADP-ribose deacetylase (regulator of RNase III)